MATTRSKKRELESLDAEEPDAKKPKLDEPLVEERDEWFKCRALSTLTVHVKIFDQGCYTKKQTHLLHLHCIPGVLAVNSKWFEAIIESDPTVTDIEMPDSFSFLATRKEGPHGVTTPLPETVIKLFRFFHFNGTLDVEGCIYSCMLMAHYIDASDLYEKLEEKISDVTARFIRIPINDMVFADYLKSERFFNRICDAIRTHKYDITYHKEETVKLIEELPRGVLDRAFYNIISKL